MRKEKVLNKRPAAKDVNDEDVLFFKDVFEEPRVKVHINPHSSVKKR
jgi:hypothetical protein